jgi:polar amino acid transport system substrate-binding protein
MRQFMVSFTSRGRTAAVLLTAACIGLGTAGCGSSSDDDNNGAARGQASFSQTLHDALPASIRKSGVLTVAGDASYAPAESFAPDGHTIVGFDPDLADAIGSVLGVKVRFTNGDFDSLLDRVAAHRVDAVMSALTDTAERERTVDFVNYFSAGTSIVVQRGNRYGITDLAGLCGTMVAVEKSTTQVDLLSRAQRQCHGRPIVVKQYDTNADALLQLRTGRVHAVLNDYAPAVAVTTDPKTRGQYQLASTTQYEPGLYGIAVAKDNQSLRETLESAVNALIRSGGYDQVLARWDVGEGAVPTASINAAHEGPAT